MSDQKRQLKLEDLVGYLPYGLKVLINNKGRDIFTMGNPNEYMTMSIYSVIDHNFTGLGHKLILRPLSDLTKEIEHNGERFVPIIELAKIFQRCKYEVTSYGKTGSYLYEYKSKFADTGFIEWVYVKCYVENSDYRYRNYQIRYHEVLKNEYEVVQKLISWHFDIHGLIEAGLAIDLNNVKA